MKARLGILVMLAGVSMMFGSCKKEDPAPSNTLTASSLQGTWAVANAEGTEWQKGTGVVTPRASDPGTIGLKLTITGSQITIKDITGAVVYGPATFTFNETDKTILIGANGNTGLGLFNIADFVSGPAGTMTWNQREPIDADYRPEAGCGCELYFQKFWALVKMP